MDEIDQIQVGEDVYDIRDSTARQRTIPSGGSSGQVLKKSSNNDYDTEWQNEGGAAWGDIGGTLSSQTDLQNALNNKSNIGHTHGGIEIRPNYIISDVDLEDGISELAPGTLYFYYEV